MAAEGTQSTQGIELAAWARGEPREARPRGRRSTLAQISLTLSEHRGVDQQRPLSLLLLIYTLSRIALNLYVLLTPDLMSLAASGFIVAKGWPFRGKWILDSILRPVLTGLGVYAYLQRKDRLSARSPLQSWSCFLILCLASFHCDFFICCVVRHHFVAFLFLCHSWVAFLRF